MTGRPLVLTVRTSARRELVDVTDRLEASLPDASDCTSVLVHSPHTTAAVIVNEGYDPAVADDLLRRLALLAPHGRDTAGVPDDHDEGNSDSHLAAALLGTAVTLPVLERRLVLGRWQRVFLVELDGPRTRELWLFLR